MQGEIAAEWRALLGERLVCEERLTLRVAHRLQQPPSDSEVLYQNLRARNALTAFVALGDLSGQGAEEGEHSEIQRLESKLDMALELLAALSRPRREGGAEGPVLFNAHGIVFQTPQALDAGTYVDLEIFLLPGWPVPLRLFARIETSIAAETGQRQIGARFCCIDQAAADALEALVFQRHRQLVARRKSA